MADEARRLGGALGWGVSARVIRLVLSVAASVITVRVLGTFNFGILAELRFVFMGLSLVIGAGLSQGLLRYLPAWWITRDGARIRKAVSYAFVTHGILWVLVAVGVMFAEPLWHRLGIHSYTIPVLILGTWLLLPDVLSQTAIQISNAFYDTKAVSAAILCSSVVYLAMLSWLMFNDGGLREVLLAAAVAHVVTLLILIFRFKSYRDLTPPATGNTKVEAPRVRKALKYSAPFVLIGLLNLIAWRQSEVLFIGHYLDATFAALYDRAYGLPQTVLEFIPGAIWPLVMTGSAAVYLRDPDALQRTSSAYYKLLFFLTAPLSIGGVLVGDKLISLLYGQDFVQVGGVCQALFIVISLSFFAAPLSMLFYVIERPSLALSMSAITASTNVGLDIWLIPKLGLWGAVVSVASVMVLSPILSALALKRMGITVSPPWRFLAKIYSASLLMLLLWPMRGLENQAAALGLMVLAGGVVFLIGIRLFRVVSVDEQSLFKRAAPQVWRVLAPVVSGKERKF